MANTTIPTTAPADGIKYGERAIDENQLITFPNPRPGRHYDVNITLPEFTCKCPFSGYPDFATIYLTYTPNEKVVELKAIKLYINGYRDRYISHEESINQIMDDFIAAADPCGVSNEGFEICPHFAGRTSMRPYGVI